MARTSFATFLAAEPDRDIELEAQTALPAAGDARPLQLLLDNLVGKSRPFVIKEIETGRLKCSKVNRHRRIEFEELKRYMVVQNRNSEESLQRLASLSEKFGLEF